MIFIASVIFSVCFDYFSNPYIVGTPIQKAFDAPQSILLAETAAISVNAPMFVDIILDIFSSKNIQDKKLDDRFERLVLTLILIVPGIVILNCQFYHNFPFVFVAMYTIQIVGSCVASFSLLARLVPEYFPPIKIAISFVTWAFGCTLCLYIFVNPPSKIWPDTLAVSSILFSQAILFNMIHKWLKSLYQRAKAAPATGIEAIRKIVKSMSDEEFSLLLYLIFVEFFSFQVHCIVGDASSINWVNVNRTEILLGIYTLAAFSILTGVVPNRIIQKLAKSQEKQIDANHTIVRYISHEIRSPLNIIQNGVSLVLDDLQGHCPPHVNEMLVDILQAGCAASSIVDDLLNFEQIKIGTFNMKKTKVPASLCLTQIAKRCLVLTREKEIQFSVKDTLNSFGLQGVYTINVDSMRLEQAIQSLVANSIKFTPPKGSISITIKQGEQSATENSDNTEPAFQRSLLRKLSSSSSIPSNSKVHCITVRKSNNGEVKSELKTIKVEKPAGTLCIVIKDTGVGMNREQLDGVFVHLHQFNAHALHGGGGNGLGLWICKEIIRQHGGEISISSNGEGCGTVIEIKLDCFISEVEKINERVADFQNSSDFKSTKHSQPLKFIGVSPNAYSTKSTEIKLRNFQILIADDISLNRKILVKMLQKNCTGFSTAVLSKCSFQLHGSRRWRNCSRGASEVSTKL